MNECNSYCNSASKDFPYFYHLLLIYVLVVIIFKTRPLLAQGGVDEYEADDAATDMMEHDPNIINPQNSEGYGTNIQTTINNKSGRSLMKSMLRYIFTYSIINSCSSNVSCFFFCHYLLSS